MTHSFSVISEELPQKRIYYNLVGIYGMTRGPNQYQADLAVNSLLLVASAVACIASVSVPQPLRSQKPENSPFCLRTENPTEVLAMQATSKKTENSPSQMKIFVSIVKLNYGKF